MKRSKPLKRTPFKKKKLIGLKALRAKTWREMSLYVRERDKRCVTCGSTKTLQAGHFLHGDCLDFDFRNINTQCTVCNHWKHGNHLEYVPFMQQKYGQEVIDELKRLKAIPKRFTREELENIQTLIKVARENL